MARSKGGRRSGRPNIILICEPHRPLDWHLSNGETLIERQA